MAAIPSYHPDAGGEYVSVPNNYADRAAATEAFDARVFETVGKWVAPPKPQPRGVLGTGYTKTQVAAGLAASYLLWKVLL